MMPRTRKSLPAILLAAAAVVTGCRGELSNQPPIHIVQDMDFQEKFKAQGKSTFFADHRAMRLPVEGTIARGQLRALDPDPDVAKFHVYKNADGSYVTENPLPLTAETLARGEERYQIFCAVCHGEAGRGRGIVGRRFAVKPPTFMLKGNPPDVVEKPGVPLYEDGRIFWVITTGGGTTMQPYAAQIPAKDRWAIVHYIRALQYRAHN